MTEPGIEQRLAESSRRTLASCNGYLSADYLLELSYFREQIEHAEELLDDILEMRDEEVSRVQDTPVVLQGDEGTTLPVPGGVENTPATTGVRMPGALRANSSIQRGDMCGVQSEISQLRGSDVE